MSRRPRADMFVPEEEDPRTGGDTLADERILLMDYIRFHRQTLELKCSGLDAQQLATRSVEPSTLSLLGLVRHMAEVERYWFRRVVSGLDVPTLFTSEDEPDGDFDGVAGDPQLVDEAWAAWHEECAFSDRVIADAPKLEVTATDRHGRQISLRDILVHMIEEYARHNGHADLLRERIDGRIGE